MDKQHYLSQLHKLICDHFDKEDLHLLCFQLGVKYENLSGNAVDVQALSLVEMMAENGRIPDLYKELQRQRPLIDWPFPPPVIVQESENKVRVYEHARYNLAANFIGRKTELKALDTWIADDSRPMFVVVALGGTGKSALTWHWLESVKAKEDPPFKLVIWHGFYETGRIDDFLSGVLAFLGEKPQEIGNNRLQLNRLMELLAATPALIVLDGAERLLRAYSGMNAAYQGDEPAEARQARECVDPVAADLLIGLSQLQNGTKTLMTTRLLPQDLLGRGGNKLPDRIGRFDLTGLDPEDAYRFFTDWGIQTTRAEVKAVCEPLGYHPFCMALLAGYAAEDFAAPNDLRAAADYDPTADLLGKRQHILAHAYDNLPPSAQLTLGRLATFRAAVTWETIAATLGDNRKTRADLHLLEQRGLLQRSQSPAPTFDLHPIARGYAYNRLSDRVTVHTQLIIYFEAVPEPQKINSLTDLATTIELYHHLTRAERYDDAVVLFRDRISKATFYQLGAYQQRIELLRALFTDGEDKPPRLSDESAQAWTLNELANSYSLSGQPSAAVLLYQQVITISEKQGDKKITTVSLANLAQNQMPIGVLVLAADNMHRSIALCQESEVRFWETVGHAENGRLLTYCGDWEKSATELNIALELFTAERTIQYQGVTWAYRALSALLQGDGAVAQNAAQEALSRADENARTRYPHEVDYMRAHWLLGWVALTQGSYQESQARLDEALRRCRAINMVYFEPAILLAQARLARAQVNGPRSLAYAQQALTIAQRSGYVLDLADIHNHLAILALDVGNTAAARTHAQSAHDYAWCDGPPFAYHTALTEAQRILATL